MDSQAQPTITLTLELYKTSIPDECSLPFEGHEEMMLCWGLASAIERGLIVDCSNCELSKTYINNNIKPQPKD